MIIKIIYQLILLFLIVLLGQATFKEKSKMMQLTAALTLIPFILRFLMIK